MPKLFVAFLLSFLIMPLAAQTAVDPKKVEAEEKLRKDAVEFLRETAGDVSRMRSVENRISFSAEIASLMWFHEEKEARLMFAASIADFKQLLAQLDGEMNMAVPDDEDILSSGLFGSGGSPAQRKFRIAMGVRQQIVMAIAEHDADLAYAFFYETAGMISHARSRTELEQSDKSFEHQLLKQIAETNAAKAAQGGIASLKGGVKSSHIDLLEKIYAKDADKGVEFGAAILSKVKSDKKAVENFYVYKSLLSFGKTNFEASQKPGGKKAVYSRNDLRDIAEQFAQTLLEMDVEQGRYMAVGYADEIGEFAPARAVQIRSKFAEPTTRPEKVANVVMEGGTGGLSTGIAANSNSAAANREYEARQEKEKQMAEALKNLGKPLPKEERDKIVAQARKIISETKGKDKKIMALSGLATQVAMAGDKELADEIMRDAERLVNPQPRNYQDFMFSWILASGYSHANPDKAFPILEDAILRANETISAFVKVAEFVDVQQEMIDDGEVQIGMFGGSMMRGITQEAGGLADATLIALARADFVKTKALTNNFDRIEIRVLAKMMVLRAILDKKEKRPGESEFGEGELPVPVANGDK